MGISRRESIPQELEDPEDITIGEAEGDLFESDLPAPPSNKEQQTGILALPKELRNIIAGGIAGITAKSVVAPLDRIKILFQVSSAQFHFRDIFSVARNIMNTEGWEALWKGNTATMIRVFPYSGIQFMVFERAKGYFLREHQRGRYFGSGSSNNLAGPGSGRKFGLSPEESLVAGMCAGTISVICTYPLDLTRAQLAVIKKHRNHANRGFAGILADNYRSRGVPGLFRGITPTILGILPYSGIAFALNEQGKREIQHMTGRDVTTIERLQCGAFSGLVAQTITYPIEVTRRRMQTIGLVGTDTALDSLGCPQERALAARPPSMWSTVRTLYLEQGARGFFKGVSMNWMKGPVAFSISFTAFDTVQGLLESEEERAQRMPERFYRVRRRRSSQQ